MAGSLRDQVMLSLGYGCGLASAQAGRLRRRSNPRQIFGVQRTWTWPAKAAAAPSRRTMLMVKSLQAIPPDHPWSCC